MMLPEEGYLLRIFIGESDRHGGKLLYEWIVTKAREEGLAGATVMRGMMGFGAHSRMHTCRGCVDNQPVMGPYFVPLVPFCGLLSLG